MVSLAIIVLCLSLLPRPAFALLPPDLIYSVGPSVVQFFLVGAVLVGGLFSSLVYTGRRWFTLSRGKAWLAVGLIIVTVIGSIAGVYIVDLQKQQIAYQDKIALLQSVNAELEKTIHQSVPLADYQQLLAQFENGSVFPIPILSGSTTNSWGYQHQFYGDTITLYGEVAAKPFSLELDFNRLEGSAGLFTHYTFLAGNLMGEYVSDYDAVYATSTGLQPNRFVPRIVKVEAADISPRVAYQGTVYVNGEPVMFTINNLMGDFITRSLPSYMQYQSVGTAEMVYRGEKHTVQALVEGTHSVDYSKHIFFPGYQEVDATTHQFILWDDQNNFYLIDTSQVRSDTPEYPSHTWLLHKRADGETTQKGFAADVVTATGVDGRVSWQISTPDFGQVDITLAPVIPYKQTGGERVRTVVGGTITDEAGTRSIGGVLHLIE